MITKIKPCFRHCLNINQTPYLQVRNNSSVYISFLLQYNLGSTTTTKRSPVFGPGQVQKLTFPLDCSHIFLEIFSNYYYPAVLICHKDILAFAPVFYQVINNLGNLECIQVN